MSAGLSLSGTKVKWDRAVIEDHNISRSIDLDIVYDISRLHYHYISRGIGLGRV